MNNDLDDFLNSMGISSDSEVTVTIPDPEPQALSQDDYNDILQEMGFTDPPEDDYEEINEEEDEGNVEERSGIYTRLVAPNEMNQVGDMSVNQDTGELNMLTPNGVVTLDGRDLDAEEDADRERLEEAGVITPVVSPPESSHALPLDSSEGVELLLQPNSPTLLMDTSTSRFSGTEWYNEIQKQRVIVAGIGGIGSNVVFQLARMCPASMVMYDDDTVETVNMSGQLFSTEDVGKNKVDAMIDMITKYTSMRNIYAAKQRFDASCEAGDIMICGFDNMAARKAFFTSWLSHLDSKTEEEKKKCLFLDGRLSIDTLQVFALTGDDVANIKRYCNNYLFSDEEADETICSMKQTTYLACMIGSVIVNLFTNFVAGTLNPIIPYDLPFFTEYDAQNMIFKTEK